MIMAADGPRARASNAREFKSIEIELADKNSQSPCGLQKEKSQLNLHPLAEDQIIII
jgi:hypothetical protein